MCVEKFDPIRMAELLRVEDPDADGGLTLVFEGGKSLKIRAVDGSLVSEVS